MDDTELREKIALLREKRGRSHIMQAETVRSLSEDELAGEKSPDDEPFAEHIPPTSTSDTPIDTRLMRFESRTPGRITRERVPISRRLDYYPVDSYDPTEPPPEEPAVRKEGVWGAVTMQAILAVIVAILFAVCRLLSPETAAGFLSTVKDKAVHDFSFRDALYKMAGDAITTLNGLTATQSLPDAPLSSSETSSHPDGEANTSLPENDAAGSASSTSAVKTNQPLSFVESPTSVAANGQGGAYTPTDRSDVPANATYAPIVFTGALTFPLKTGWRQTSAFGFRENPIYGGNEFHTAADIAAAQGTSIMAVFGGVIIESGQDRWLGNYVRIDHGNGFYSTYGHCDRLVARAGMHVRRGEVIAKVGSTGDSTGYHLHLALEMNGLYFDPAWIFPHQLYSAWNIPAT